MVLRHRDTEVLRFDWVEPFGVKNVERNSSNAQFLPLSFRDRVQGADDRTFAYELEEWLLRRTAPLNRHGIRATLRTLGFDPEDPQWKKNLLTFSRALSLNDVYWLAQDDSSERWADANLYRNPFSTAVATMAFTGERQRTPRDASTSPEYSTDGNLAKCWRRIDGQVLLYKGGTRSHGGFDENDDCGFEPYSEYYAAQLAAAMRLPHVDYGLAEFKHRLCSTCPLFTSEAFGYLPAREVMTRDRVLRDTRFSDVFFFDALIFNTDRHLGNFGFLVDNETNEISGIAPIFDNGYGLFSQARNCSGRPEDEFCDLRRFASRREPKLYRDWLDIPGGITDEMIDRLKGLEKFEFRPHEHFAMPGNRLAVIQYFVRKCISDLAAKREKSTIYAEIAGMRDTINSKSVASGAGWENAEKTEGEKLTDEALLSVLRESPTATRTTLAQRFGVSSATIARRLKALQSAGLIRRVGSRKTGAWVALLANCADLKKKQTLNKRSERP